MPRIPIRSVEGTRPRNDSVSEWIVSREVRPRKGQQDIDIVRADLRYPITVRIGENNAAIPEKSVLCIKASFLEIIGWRPERVAIEFADYVPNARDLVSDWYVERCIGSELRIKRLTSTFRLRTIICRSSEENEFPHWWQRQRGIIRFSPDGKSISAWETDEVDIGR